MAPSSTCLLALLELSLKCILIPRGCPDPTGGQAGSWWGWGTQQR